LSYPLPKRMRPLRLSSMTPDIRRQLLIMMV
jgi:hypothetical protein